MEVKSLLMVMATLTIAGCSQNEMTEMNPDTAPRYKKYIPYWA